MSPRFDGNSRQREERGFLFNMERDRTNEEEEEMEEEDEKGNQ